MNIYKQCMLGLEQGIQREIADILHNVCAGGGLIGAQAKDRLQTLKRAAVGLRDIIDGEERNHAHEVTGAEASDVRGSFRQRQAWDPQEGRGGIRGQRQAWEATEVRPQIEKKEGLNHPIDYKGSDP